MKRPDDESTSLSDFGDELVSGRTHSTADGVESTMHQVQRTVGVLTGQDFPIPSSRKTAILEDLMNSQTTVRQSVAVIVPPMSMRAVNRPADRFRQNLMRWQSGISLAVVLAILVGLVAIVYQAGPLQESDGPGASTFGQVQYDPDDPSIILPVSESCQSNGEVPTEEEIAAMRISDWVVPQYYPAKFTDEATGAAIQQTYLNYMICLLARSVVGTPVSNATLEVSAEMTSYFSDRYRLARMYESLPSNKQENLLPYLCAPRQELIEQNFPITVNRPYRYMAVDAIDGNRVDVDVSVFDSSAVYYLPDGRYGAMIGSVSTAILQNPDAIGHDSITFFIAFVEVEGRYFIDEFVGVFTGIEPGSDRAQDLPWTCP